MTMQVQPYRLTEFQSTRLETIILAIGDSFNIRIIWDADTKIITGVCAVVGGMIGGYAGGRLAAAIGAGLGGATGFTVAQIMSLRELWTTIREKLKDLLYIVYNFIRRFEPEDYVKALKIIMANKSMKIDLALTIIEFITQELKCKVLSNLNDNQSIMYDVTRP